MKIPPSLSKCVRYPEFAIADLGAVIVSFVGEIDVRFPRILEAFRLTIVRHPCSASQAIRCLQCSRWLSWASSFKTIITMLEAILAWD